MTGPDPDDWAKEECACGHRRHAHNMVTDECMRTVQRVDFTGLPEAEYAPGEQDSPLAWPTNWPPAADLPVVEVPCGCKHFHDYEPSEPDEEQR